MKYYFSTSVPIGYTTDEEPTMISHITGPNQLAIYYEELHLGPPNTNPSSGREEDLNPAGPPDYKSTAIITRPRRLRFLCQARENAGSQCLKPDMGFPQISLKLKNRFLAERSGNQPLWFVLALPDKSWARQGKMCRFKTRCLAPFTLGSKCYG